MKSNIYIILFCSNIFLIGCIPLKTAPSVENHTIVKGDKLKKLKLSEGNHYMLKNPGKMLHFRDFLAKKYSLKNFTYTDSFPVTINGTQFRLGVSTPEFIESRISLIDAIIDNNNDCENQNEIDNNEENKRRYISLTLSYNGEDCLSENSLFYEIAKSYLYQLSQEYLNTYAKP